MYYMLPDSLNQVVRQSKTGRLEMRSMQVHSFSPLELNYLQIVLCMHTAGCMHVPVFFLTVKRHFSCSCLGAFKAGTTYQHQIFTIRVLIFLYNTLVSFAGMNLFSMFGLNVFLCLPLTSMASGVQSSTVIYRKLLGSLYV